MPGFLIGGTLRVAVTRPRARAAAACEELRARGFVPIVRSLVRAEPAAESLASALDEVIRDAASGERTWLLFTSAEAVRAMDTARRAMSVAWPAVHIACVGPATAAAAARAGLRVAVMPSHHDGVALAAALLEHGSDSSRSSMAGMRVHWPRAEGAGKALPDALSAAGALVLDTVAYRTLPDAGGALRLQRDLVNGVVDAVLFFSPSAVDAFIGIIGMPPPWLTIGVIGRTTGARARQYGMSVHVEPGVHSITTLADQLRQYADSHGKRTEREP